MTVMAIIPVRLIESGRAAGPNKATATRTRETTLARQHRSRAVTPLIGHAFGEATLIARHGAVLSQQRLFLVARCDGQPIVWPKPTHGPGLKPYRTAADIIDWSLPCPSIFERKRPLADNTCRRIAEGIRRFVVESADPFIVPTGSGISIPYMVPRYSEAPGQRPRTLSIQKPLPTIVPTGNHGQLVQAFLAKPYTGVVGTALRKPLGTITTVDHHSLVTAHIQRDFGNSIGSDIREPLGTITAGGGGKAALVQAFLMKYYSEGGQWQSLKEPMHTIPTKDRMGLVMVKGEPYAITDICMRMVQPPELFAGQGFPADYIHTHTFDGARLTKADQVKMCGNSVSPLPCKALVVANMTQPMEIAA